MHALLQSDENALSEPTKPQSAYDLGMSNWFQLLRCAGCARFGATAQDGSVAAGDTLAWMLVECGVSIYAAKAAHSAALLAFGSDSFVELLSASVVLAQFHPALRLRNGASIGLPVVCCFCWL